MGLDHSSVGVSPWSSDGDPTPPDEMRPEAPAALPVQASAKHGDSRSNASNLLAAHKGPLFTGHFSVLSAHSCAVLEDLHSLPSPEMSPRQCAPN